MKRPKAPKSTKPASTPTPPSPPSPPPSTAIVVRTERTAEAALTHVLETMATPSIEELWLGNKSPETARAYRGDLENFATFLGVPAKEALEAFLRLDHGRANAIALAYQRSLLNGPDGTSLTAATINRRMAALRSVVKLGRKIGRVSWALDVENIPAEAYRDTAGPGVEAVKKMLKTLKGTENEIRDRAVLMCLYSLALRRGELAGVRYPDDVDVPKQQLWILGKGRRQREHVAMPEATLKALKAWLKARGSAPGSLFGLNGGQIYYLVGKAGKRAGVGHVWPHGFRHTSITSYLDRSNGNMRGARSFARHKDSRVTDRYDDNRKNLFGEAAQLVASGLDDAEDDNAGDTE